MRKCSAWSRAVGVALVVVGCEDISRTDSALRPIDVGNEPLANVDPALSTITIPLRVPLAVIRDRLTEGVPKHVSDSVTLVKGVRNPLSGGKIGSCTFRWQITRTPLTLRSGDDDRLLQISTSLRGEGDASCTPDISVAGGITLTLRPEIDGEWRLHPNAAASLDLSEAKIWGAVSVRSELRPRIQKLLDRAVAKFNADVGGDDFVHVALQQAWQDLCRTVELGSDSGAWLSVTPSVVRIAQTRFTDAAVELDFGLDVLIGVVTDDATSGCPFPSRLIVQDGRLSDATGQGSISLALDARVDYEWLSRTIETAAWRTIVRLEGTTPEGGGLGIKALHVRPSGDRLLLETTLVATLDGWFRDTQVEVTLYVWGHPRVEYETQTLVLEGLEVDSASRNLLIDALGELAEPMLLERLAEHGVIALDEHLRRLRAHATEALQGISSDGLHVDGAVDAISLTGIDVGPDYLRVVTTATGWVTVEAREI